MSEFATRMEAGAAPITTVDPPEAEIGLTEISREASLGAEAGRSDFSTHFAADDTLFEPAEHASPEPVGSVAPPGKISHTEVVPIFSSLDTNAEPLPPRPAVPFAPEDSDARPFVPQPPPPSPPRVDSGAEISMDGDRRTMLSQESSSAIRGSRGRIVGWLITYSHDPDGLDYRVYAGYNRIGANPVCDIVVEDETVSGSHAIIVYRDGRCLIKDDLSRNGTFVNGREISESYPLQSYDQIRVGNTYLTFIAAQRIV